MIVSSMRNIHSMNDYRNPEQKVSRRCLEIEKDELPLLTRGGIE
jgi:hypothetical protein